MKYIKLTVILLCFTMLGCMRHDPEPNENRGTDYEFDIVDYLDITAFGEDGNGYLEIKVKDITADDFFDDSEYIKVKKDLDNIDPYLIPTHSTSLKVSQDTLLKNGDVVTIEFPYNPDNLYSDMNIEDYDYVVSGLEEAEGLDLFNDEAVTFFADEEGGLHFHKKPGYLPDDIYEMLSYEIVTEDEVEPNKTVMSVTATLDETYLKEKGYYSSEVFFAKHGFKVALNVDKVLKEVVKPTDFSGMNSTKVESSLYEMLEKVEDEQLVKICNIQKSYKQKLNEPYSFTVIYYDLINGENVYFSRAFDAYFIDGELVYENIGRKDFAKEEYATETLPESDMIMKFMN